MIVNNLEFDHADIFPDLDAIKLSFRRLLNIVPGEGMVLINGDDENAIDVAQGCAAQLVEVGFSSSPLISTMPSLGTMFSSRRKLSLIASRSGKMSA